MRLVPDAMEHDGALHNGEGLHRSSTEREPYAWLGDTYRGRTPAHSPQRFERASSALLGTEVSQEVHLVQASRASRPIGDTGEGSDTESPPTRWADRDGLISTRLFHVKQPMFHVKPTPPPT
jgi:hypothetical protein